MISFLCILFSGNAQEKASDVNRKKFPVHFTSRFLFCLGDLSYVTEAAWCAGFREALHICIDTLFRFAYRWELSVDCERRTLSWGGAGLASGVASFLFVVA